MKILIPAKDKSMNSLMADRFARAEIFAIIDEHTGEIEWIDNTIAEAHGAGPKVIQFFINKGVDVFIAPQFGENATNAIHAAGVKGYVAEKKTLKNLLEDLQKGNLQAI